MRCGIGKDVLSATLERMSYVFDNFPKIYVSFSAGKDSSVMLHLAAEEALRRGRKIGVLLIDLEGQYKQTIKFAQLMFDKYADVIEPYWVCLPIALRNAVSVFEPKWICWDDDKKDVWIRDLPKMGIHDQSFFPFFRKGMEFEQFVPEFGKWYSQGERCAAMIGIRTVESYNRHLKLTVRHNREFFNDKMWLLKQKSVEPFDIYSCHPIYDWKTEDIWRYNGKFKKEYNPLYDVMHQAGLTIHQQRICQPYGDDQRKGLHLFQVIEPDTWGKILSRVSGANSGAEFVKYPGNSSGQIRVTKPEGHTWKSFTELLLDTMPEISRDHYANKIHAFIRFYEERGFRHGIPDEADPSLEAQHKTPSWRRIAKMLLRNDYWGKTIGFVQTKDGYFYTRYMERMKRDRANRAREEMLRSRNGIQRLF